MKVLSVLIAVTTCLPAPAQQDKVTAEYAKNGDVNIHIAGKPFGVYRINMDGKLPKPFLLPVRAADGTILTRPLEDPEDHPHHKGVWVSVDRVNDVDFWAEKGRIVTKEVGVIHNDAPQLRVTNVWQSLDGKPVVEEQTWITFYPDRLIAYDIRFNAKYGPVRFDDTKEGLFGFRMVNSLREKETGKVINAEGQEGTKNCWGKPSAWIDYYGKVNKGTYGVALFDHPKNLRKSRYHVRNYGLFSISPFGEKAYTGGKQPAAPVTIEAGKSLQLRYAIYLHDGDTKTGRVAEMYQQYLKRSTTIPAR